MLRYATTMSVGLSGKVAVVIGGSGDIGSAIAEELSLAGAQTVITYVEDQDAAQRVITRLNEMGGAAEAARLDARDAEQVAALFADVVHRHDRVDIVVHLPGQVVKKSFAELSDADYTAVVDLNLRTAFNVLRATGGCLADGGRCVLVSTTLTGVVPGPYGLYAAAKAGVEVMVRAAAAEWGGRGITVNAVAPGPIDNAFFRGPETADSIAAASTFSPRARLGLAEDVAPVVGFLVGDAAGWVSGQTVRVNGGMF
jgi:3-oxoacyl-[acyl-carrier protein] reductase